LPRDYSDMLAIDCYAICDDKVDVKQSDICNLC
jgi:hypothetical protein